ncbi:MAG: tetratricopeptide repeat protein [Actinomycetes bacterium]|jgi:tetratricopeptide (TPR) repeat protein|nr:tetratricopeptide repeat protein [Actinomycetes bacterium]
MTQADDWERRISAVWSMAATRSEAETVAAIDALVAERPTGDGAALFEWASVLDFAGREDKAEPYYRQALAAGLDRYRRPRAVIQLASTLRNLGRPHDSIAILRAEIANREPDSLDDARLAFLALALADAGRPAEAVIVLLDAIAGHLTDYRRAVTFYSGELRDRYRPPSPHQPGASPV